MPKEKEAAFPLRMPAQELACLSWETGGGSICLRFHMKAKIWYTGAEGSVLHMGHTVFLYPHKQF
jgi:hypothetical protein